MSEHFCPIYPKPRFRRKSVWSMFFSARHSWMDSLYERSYRMQMGEVHLPGVDLYMVNDPAVVQQVMVQDKTFYRVRLGPFTGNEEASRVRAELAKNGIDVTLTKKEP